MLYQTIKADPQLLQQRAKQVMITAMIIAFLVCVIAMIAVLADVSKPGTVYSERRKHSQRINKLYFNKK